MTKVFIGGSRRLSRLNAQVRQRLDNIMHQSYDVLVGDANGVDKAIQSYMAECLYQRVTVFFAGARPRNNVGDWPTRRVEVGRKTRDFKFYMAKDLHMAQEADYGFMMWDGKSAGTLSNILELIEKGKKALVYFAPDKTFLSITTRQQLQKAIGRCPEKARETFDRKFAVSSRLANATGYQPSLFS